MLVGRHVIDRMVLLLILLATVLCEPLSNEPHDLTNVLNKQSINKNRLKSKGNVTNAFDLTLKIFDKRNGVGYHKKVINFNEQSLLKHFKEFFQLSSSNSRKPDRKSGVKIHYEHQNHVVAEIVQGIMKDNGTYPTISNLFIVSDNDGSKASFSNGHSTHSQDTNDKASFSNGHSTHSQDTNDKASFSNGHSTHSQDTNDKASFSNGHSTHSQDTNDKASFSNGHSTHSQDTNDKASFSNGHSTHSQNTNDKASAKRAFKRATKDKDYVKETQTAKIAVHQKLTDIPHHMSSRYFDLRVMYEKRGGVCTLVKGYSKTPIYVISSCPLGTMQTKIRDLCEHVSYSARLYDDNSIDITTTPVQDFEGFVYKNVYCAQCNDIESVQAWNTKLDCDHFQPLSISDGNDQLTLLNEFSDGRTGCQRTLLPAIPRMIHQCDHPEVTSLTNNKLHMTRLNENIKGDISPFPLSFSILMNFGFDGKTHILFSTTANPSAIQVACRIDEKYDTYSQKCRPIICNDGYILVDGSCKRNPMNYDDDDYLPSLNDIEEPVQVVLTIKNVTYSDIVIMSFIGIEESLALTLASIFNISVHRLDNLTVSLVNASGENESGIEIHKFTTPLPTKMIMQGDTLSNPTLEHFLSDHEPPNISVSASNNTWIQSENRAKIFYNVTVKSNNSDEALEQDNANENHTNCQSSHPSQTDDNGKNAEQYIQIALRISFILKPAHRNRTLLEKSIQNVVQTMTDLVNHNSFMITINGTDLQVQGMDSNTPQPASMDNFCNNGVNRLLSAGDFDLEKDNDPRTGYNFTVVVKAHETRYFPGQYDLTLHIDGNVGNLNQTTVSQFVFVCDMPKIVDEECGRIVLNINEYSLFENKSISYANHVFNLSEYEYRNETYKTVSICTPAWFTNEQFYNQSQWTMACGQDLVKLVTAESYLTFILGLISLVCMLSVLITYGVFKKLRNLPGVNTVNLTSSLFMGEFVFIVSGWIQRHQEWLCSCVGMLLHYLFLTSFFWMNVMSYDVYRTFAKKCILLRLHGKNKYLLKYSLYAWGCPFIIVAICAALDFGDLVDGIEIGYGGSQSLSGHEIDTNNSSNNKTLPFRNNQIYSIGCWIQKPVASMVAFGGPMIIILLSNAVMFARTIVSIRASNKYTRSSVRSSPGHRLTGRHDVMLYVRMSTVMGFTWFFGLASSVVSAIADPTVRTTCIILHLFGFLFIVFNCSQGMFICFVFVFNKRVKGMYRILIERLIKDKNRPLMPSPSRVTLKTNLSQSSVAHIT